MKRRRITLVFHFKYLLCLSRHIRFTVGQYDQFPMLVIMANYRIGTALSEFSRLIMVNVWNGRAILLLFKTMTMVRAKDVMILYHFYQGVCTAFALYMIVTRYDIRFRVKRRIGAMVHVSVSSGAPCIALEVVRLSGSCKVRCNTISENTYIIYHFHMSTRNVRS